MIPSMKGLPTGFAACMTEKKRNGFEIRTGRQSGKEKGGMNGIVY